MFDESFPYKLIQKRSLDSRDIISEAYYSFNSSKRRYIVLVEEYPLQVFVPKFFPSSYRNSPHKYNLILNDFEASRIIRTCLNIMLDFNLEFPEASFAFVGANTKSKNKSETKIQTQRFRVYKNLMLNFFDTEHWWHYDDMLSSSYLLVKRNKPNFSIYIQNVIKMFSDIYHDLEHIQVI